MVADARADGLRIARRKRSSAGTELSRRWYLVIAVIAPVSTAVGALATAERVSGTTGIDGPWHKPRAWFAHRQTFLGVLGDGGILCRRSR